MKTKQYTIDEMIDQAVTAEREACVKVAESVCGSFNPYNEIYFEGEAELLTVLMDKMATAIRARSEVSCQNV